MNIFTGQTIENGAENRRTFVSKETPSHSKAGGIRPQGWEN